MKKLLPKMEKVCVKQSIFNNAMIYLIEHNALSLEDGRIVFNSENFPEEQFHVCNNKTKMIQRIKNACEKM